MATTYYAPDPIQSMQFIPGGIVPANGGQLFFYAAGTSTKTTVYKDNAGAVAWSNPIVLDSGGNLPLGGEVWFQAGVTYKVVFAPSNDTDPPASPYWTKDNLQGINDVSGQLTALEWVTGPTPTFVSTTSFSVVGDQTSVLTNGRRIKSTNTAGTIYSTIVGATFSLGTTTVRIVNDSGVLDAGLSAMSYALINPANTSVSDQAIDRKATAVASVGGGTTNIWGINGNYVHVTGTNSISNFSTASYAGMVRDVVFDGALVLASSAALTIPGNLNISTAAGDTMRVRAETVSTATIMMYTPASGTPLFGVQSSGRVFAGPSSGAAATPAFRTLTGAESALILLSATSNATSGAVTISGLDASFDEYQLHIINLIPGTNSVGLLMRTSTNNAASFESGASAYNWSCQARSSSGTDGAASGGGPTTDIRIASNAVNFALSNISTNSYSGVVKIYSPGNITMHKRYSWEAVYGNDQAVTSPQAMVIGAGAFIGNTASTQAIQITPTAGTFSSNSFFYLYGVRKS